MKRLLVTTILTVATLIFSASPASAIEELQQSTPQNLCKYLTGSIEEADIYPELPSDPNAGFFQCLTGSIALNITGVQGIKDGQLRQLKTGALMPTSSKYMAMLYEDQAMPSSREYIADILDNIGIPQVSSAYAQGTGYSAISPFLSIWKIVRNLAYALYIIIFVVVGIMIMLRTKVNAQTVITIQSALPNLLITLVLITFSYAIVGFMIDLMYFLIYFVVYLLSSPTINLISTPTKAIDRLLNYSAYAVIFEGRNAIVSAIALSIGEVLSGLGTGALEVAGTIVSWLSPTYLLVAGYLAFQMIKLMFNLIKSYVMLLVQIITAPVQILFNALPGSKAFSTWLKTTASYLIPFPVAAAMFIFAAVLIGDPTKTTIFHTSQTDNNYFGINQSNEFYTGYGGAYNNPDDKIWLPPFTLTGSVDFNRQDIMTIIGFFVFTMTASVVKMAQEWMQVKESPYAAEALQGFVGLGQTAIGYPAGFVKQARSVHEQKTIQEWGAKRYADEVAAKMRQQTATEQNTGKKA